MKTIQHLGILLTFAAVVSLIGCHKENTPATEQPATDTTPTDTIVPEEPADDIYQFKVLDGDGDSVSLMCILQDMKVHITKKGGKMSFITVSDGSGELEAVVFPDLYELNAAKLREDSILFLNGKISLKDESVTVICGSIFAESELSRMVENMKLCVKADSSAVPLAEMTEVCSRYQGETEVCFFLADAKKIVRPRNKLSITINHESFKALTEHFSADSLRLIR